MILKYCPRIFRIFSSNIIICPDIPPKSRRKRSRIRIPLKTRIRVLILNKYMKQIFDINEYKYKKFLMVIREMFGVPLAIRNQVLVLLNNFNKDFVIILTGYNSSNKPG